MTVAEWLSQSWIMLTAIVAGVAVIFKLIEQIKEIKGAVLKPLNEINTKIDSLDAKQEMQNRAVLSLQRRSIKDACEECFKKKYATLNEKETIAKQFESYHELGGNSFIAEMVEQVKDLPIEAPKQNRKPRAKK